MKLSLLILGFLFSGLIKNPVAIVFNFPWLVPIFLSPIILYLWQQPDYKDIVMINNFDNN